MQNVPKGQDVIGVLGEKANSQVPTERGETSTILTFANAAGQVLPPLVIHKGHRVNDSWIQGASPDIMVRASVKGYITKEYFMSIPSSGYSGCAEINSFIRNIFYCWMSTKPTYTTSDSSG